MGYEYAATTQAGSEFKEVTWNVPREVVDGFAGEVHTGINSEVLKLHTVQKVRQQFVLVDFVLKLMSFG
jgi:hypothetical protein